VPATDRLAILAEERLEQVVDVRSDRRAVLIVVVWSPFHLLRLFKQEAGVTPYRFLIRARIRRAVALLLDTRRPITAIAFEVGFGDLSNFIHVFRREVGRSPRDFRRLR
jgi:AraC-like DNA-binding protein